MKRVAIKNMEMPNYCTEVIEKENKGGWVSASVKRCPLYNVCKEKETVRANFKPASCPLMEIVTCEYCKYSCRMTDAPKVLLCEKHGCQRVSKNFYCADARRRE